MLMLASPMREMPLSVQLLALEEIMSCGDQATVTKKMQKATPPVHGAHHQDLLNSTPRSRGLLKSIDGGRLQRTLTVIFAVFWAVPQ